MGIPDGAHTHGSGSGGGGMTVLAVLALVAAAAVARPVIHAATEILMVVLIAVAVLVGVGITGLVGLLTWKGHRTHPHAARVRSPAFPKSGAGRSATPRDAGRSAAPEPRPALDRPAGVHLHLHGCLQPTSLLSSGRAAGPAPRTRDHAALPGRGLTSAPLAGVIKAS